MSDAAPWGEDESIGESLPTPTRIHVKPVLQAMEEDLVKDMAYYRQRSSGDHSENAPQALGRVPRCRIVGVPKVLRWLEKAGNI